jgi:hypothetical protein
VTATVPPAPTAIAGSKAPIAAGDEARTGRDHFLPSSLDAETAISRPLPPVNRPSAQAT